VSGLQEYPACCHSSGAGLRQIAVLLILDTKQGFVVQSNDSGEQPGSDCIEDTTGDPGTGAGVDGHAVPCQAKIYPACSARVTAAACASLVLGRKSVRTVPVGRWTS